MQLLGWWVCSTQILKRCSLESGMVTNLSMVQIHPVWIARVFPLCSPTMEISNRMKTSRWWNGMAILMQSSCCKKYKSEAIQTSRGPNYSSCHSVVPTTVLCMKQRILDGKHSIVIIRNNLKLGVCGVWPLRHDITKLGSVDHEV